MAGAYSTIVIRDGNGTVVSGGIAALDQSGGGVGPWNFANILVDGVNGINRAVVNGTGALSIVITTGAAPIGSLTTGTATIGGIFLVTGTSAIGSVSITTGSAPIGSLTTGTAPIGTVALTTGSAPIGSLTTGTNPIGSVILNTGSSPIGSLTAGAAAIGSIILNTGSSAIGSVILNTGSSAIGTVQPGNTPNTTPWLVAQTPTTGGGVTISSTLCVTGNNATLIRASGANLVGWSVTNNSANIAYVKLYDSASTPTTGAGTPKIRIMVPGNTGGAGNNWSSDTGINFASGLGFVTTSGILDGDTTVVATGAFIINLMFK